MYPRVGDTSGLDENDALSELECGKFDAVGRIVGPQEVKDAKFRLGKDIPLLA